MTIFLRTLGQIDLRDSEETELRSLLTQPKRMAVLVYLASTATTRLCRRDSLLAMFWPESDSERARAALRQALHFIRQGAGSDIVVTRGADEIGLQPGSVQLDSAMLDELADSHRYEEAVAQFQGDFLDGFFVRGAPEFERWVSGERERLRRRAAECAWKVVEQRVAAGDLDGARAMAERGVRLSADSEIAVRRFIELLARSGDRTAALTVYREFATHLAEEFGVQPSSETLALVASLSEPQPVPRRTASGIADAIPDTGGVAAARKTSRTSWWTGAAIAIAALAVFGYQYASNNRRPELDPNRIAVLPFMVQGTPGLRYLHDGLPLLLSNRLDGMQNLRTVDMRAVLLEQSRRGPDSLTLESATKTAEKFGAQLYIVGSVVGSPGSISVDAQLYDGTRAGKAIARAQVSGSEAEIVGLVDKITVALLAERFKDTGGLAAEMAARTTTSFVALKAWLEGESQLARGRYLPAIASFKNAVAADTMFAMAYYRLAVAAAWAGTEPSYLAAQRAVALSDRLPPTARIMVQAFLDSRTGRYADAERAQRRLLAERPTSIDVWFDFGEVLYHANPARGRPISEAQEAFEQLYRMDPQSFAAMSHLVRLAAARKDTKALDSLSRLALVGDPDGPHRAELFLLRGLALDDKAARDAFLAMPQELTMLDALWRAAEYTEELEGISRLAEAQLSSAVAPEMRASLFLLLAHVALGREKFAIAEKYVDSLSAYAPRSGATTMGIVAQHPSAGSLRPNLLQRARTMFASAEKTRSKVTIYAGTSRPDNAAPYFMKERGRVFAALGDTTAARTFLRSVEPIGRAQRVELAIALAASDADRASALREGLLLDTLYGNSYAPQQPLGPRVRLHLGIADLLERAGRHPEALARLATVPEDFGFNIGFLAEVHRRRAALLTRMGKTEEAAAETRRVTALLR